MLQFSVYSQGGVGNNVGTGIIGFPIAVTIPLAIVTGLYRGISEPQAIATYYPTSTGFTFVQYRQNGNSAALTGGYWNYIVLAIQFLSH